jgi:hypothetical protein
VYSWAELKGGPDEPRPTPRFQKNYDFGTVAHCMALQQPILNVFLSCDLSQTGTIALPLCVLSFFLQSNKIKVVIPYAFPKIIKQNME